MTETARWWMTGIEIGIRHWTQKGGLLKSMARSRGVYGNHPPGSSADDPVSAPDFAEWMLSSALAGGPFR